MQQQMTSTEGQELAVCQKERKGGWEVVLGMATSCAGAQKEERMAGLESRPQMSIPWGEELHLFTHHRIPSAGNVKSGHAVGAQ